MHRVGLLWGCSVGIVEVLHHSVECVSPAVNEILKVEVLLIEVFKEGLGLCDCLLGFLGLMSVELAESVCFGG